jgi:hypothetical protein
LPGGLAVSGHVLGDGCGFEFGGAEQVVATADAVAADHAVGGRVGGDVDLDDAGVVVAGPRKRRDTEQRRLNALEP